MRHISIYKVIQAGKNTVINWAMLFLKPPKDYTNILCVPFGK